MCVCVCVWEVRFFTVGSCTLLARTDTPRLLARRSPNIPIYVVDKNATDQRIENITNKKN